MQRNCPSQHLDEVWRHRATQALDTRWRPVVRPFRQRAGEHPVDHQPQSEDIGPKRRFSECLLRSQVPDRTRSGRRDRPGAQCDLGDTEIRQAHHVARKQKHVLRLDVTVDDSVFVRVRDGVEQLARVGHGSPGRESTGEAVRERRFGQGMHDDEDAVDEGGGAQRQNVRVLEPGRDADFAQNVVHELGAESLVVRDLDGDPPAFNRVQGPVDVREAPGADAAFDTVFPESLSRSEFRHGRENRSQ